MSCSTEGRFIHLLFVSAPFHQKSILQKAIHALKYQGIRSLTQHLASIATPGFHDLGKIMAARGAVIIPVPLSDVRQHERGFNQAALLALAWGQRMSLTIETELLFRTVDTVPQASLDRQRRLTNVCNAFACNGPAPPVVLLVDDVATTLSTLEACAATLRRHGTKFVGALVLARALRSV